MESKVFRWTKEEVTWVRNKLDRILERSAILNCECCKYKNDYFVAHI